MNKILSTITGFLLGRSWAMVLFLSLTSAIAAGTWAWNIRAWKADSQVASVQHDYDTYKLNIADGVAKSTKESLDQLITLATNLQDITDKANAAEKARIAASNTLVKDLKNVKAENDQRVGLALESYITGLYNIQQASRATR